MATARCPRGHLCERPRNNRARVHPCTCSGASPSLKSPLTLLPDNSSSQVNSSASVTSPNGLKSISHTFPCSPERSACEIKQGLRSGWSERSSYSTQGCRCGSDPALLWLWCRPAATAPIRPLAWEPPYAASAALKSKKKIYIYIYIYIYGGTYFKRQCLQAHLRRGHLSHTEEAQTQREGAREGREETWQRPQPRQTCQQLPPVT